MEVSVSVSTNKFGECLILQENVLEGHPIFSYSFLEGVTSTEPSTYSIQIGKDLHILFESTIRYMNHSFKPSTTILVTDNRINVIAVRDLSSGEEITFDYTTTEASMATPFIDHETGILVEGFTFLLVTTQEKLIKA